MSVSFRPDLGDPSVGYPSLEALQQMHLEMVRAVASDPLALDAEDLRGFLSKAQASGANIDGLARRDAAQSLIDFWTANLASRPDQRALAYPEPVHLAPFNDADEPELAEGQRPYKGLWAFEEADAGFFFGREAAARDLREAVLSRSLVVVAGPSGSGKSSLVAAGLAPLLSHDEAVPWRIASLTPGRDPLGALAAALAPEKHGDPAWAMLAGAAALDEPTSVTALGLAADHTLLIIDQFEELVTLTELPRMRRSFCLALRALEEKGVRLVVTVRDDFLPQLKDLPQLHSAKVTDPDVQFRPPAMTSAELRRAIEQPAAIVGLKFDDGLVDALVREVSGEAAALPLLQFVLAQLWLKRDRNRITWDAYREVGRPAVALGKVAQELFETLEGRQRDDARLIFQALVQPSQGRGFARRPVPRADLVAALDAARVDAVLLRYVEAGLVRETRAEDGPTQTRYDVVHEALILHWPQLSTWLEEKRRETEAKLQLEGAAELWRKSGRRRGYLISGAALAQAEKYAKVSKDLSDFVQASREAVKGRLGGLVGVLLAIAVLVLAVFALQRSKDMLQDDQQNAAATIENAERTQAVTAISDAQAQAAIQTLSDLLDRGLITADDLPPTLRDLARASAAGIDFSRAPEPFDANFLGEDAAISVGGDAALRRLTYPHFALGFSPGRHMAVYGVSNHDRRALIGKEAAPVGWITDRRAGPQLDDAFFAQREIAKGQLVSPAEVAWGAPATRAAALEALNAYTNAAPQPWGFATGQWAEVQSWLLVKHNPRADRVVYLTGPVLPRAGDGPATPVGYWKIAVSRRDASSPALLVVDAALVLTRPEKAPAPPAFKDDLPGRSTVAAIETLTGLDFGQLRLFDRRPIVPQQTVAPQLAQVIQPAGAPSRIFVHFADMERSEADRVRDALRRAGFNSPATQAVAASAGRAEVRYFFEGDKAKATSASQVAARTLKELGYAQALTLRPLSAKNFPRARPGTVELWISGRPSGPTKGAPKKGVSKQPPSAVVYAPQQQQMQAAD